MNNPILIQPANHARAVVVLESDEPQSRFSLYLIPEAAEAASYLIQRPAIFAWLPAFAHGELTVFTKNEKVAGEPRHVYDLRIQQCADLRIEPPAAEDESASMASTATHMDNIYHVQCPPGSNHWVVIFCEEGKTPHCDVSTGVVDCRASVT